MPYPFEDPMLLERLISRNEIAVKIEAIAKKLNKIYQDKECTIIMILKGSICLVADLIRFLKIPTTIEYLHCSSYGQRGTRRGKLNIEGLETLKIEDKEVLIIDDIFDSGETLSFVISAIYLKNPKSLHSLVLLKKKVTHHVDYRPDYTLFEIEDRFVVGYGLDYKEYYRGLPDIYTLPYEEESS